MTELLLSVVVPVRNAAEYLSPLSDAFSRQASDAFEVIFIDDGSDDGSCALIDEIARSGAFRALAIHQKNAGASAARNAGMARATGRYLAFVDADDAVAPDYAKALTAAAAEGGDLYLFRHTRVVKGAAAFDNLSGRAREATAEMLLEAFISNPTCFGVYDLLVRRALVESEGLKFPEGYPYYEDYDFILRILSAAKAIREVDRCVYCYRAAPGSAMSIFSDERLRCLELFDAGRSQYLENRPSFYAHYRKWFVARLSWSVLWQAAVAMDARAIRDFSRKSGMRARMRGLKDYPDRRVRLSARLYGLCPGLAIILMKACGKGRTLLRRGDER